MSIYPDFLESSVNFHNLWSFWDILAIPFLIVHVQ